MSESTNSQSVSCVYELLNDDNNSCSWSDDGVITLNRPLASTKLDKIKFRSFSANIRSDISNVTIPTLKTQLCARFINNNINNSETMNIQTTNTPGLTILNKSGEHKYIDGGGYSTQINSPFVLDECENVIINDVSQAVNDGCKYCSKQLEALLGVYPTNKQYIENNTVTEDKTTELYSTFVNVGDVDIIGYNLEQMKYISVDGQYNVVGDLYTLNKYDFVKTVSDYINYDANNNKIIYALNYILDNQNRVYEFQTATQFSPQQIIKIDVDSYDTNGVLSYGLLYNSTLENLNDFKQRFLITSSSLSSLGVEMFLYTPGENIKLSGLLSSCLTSSDYSKLTTFLSSQNAYLVDIHTVSTYSYAYSELIFCTQQYGHTFIIRFYRNAGDKSIGVRCLSYTSLYTLNYLFTNENAFILFAVNNPNNKYFFYYPQNTSNKKQYIFITGEYNPSYPTNLTWFGYTMTNSQTVRTTRLIHMVKYLDKNNFVYATGGNQALQIKQENHRTFLETHLYNIYNKYYVDYTHAAYYSPVNETWVNYDGYNSNTINIIYSLLAECRIQTNINGVEYTPKRQYQQPAFNLDDISTLIKYDSSTSTLSTIRIPLYYKSTDTETETTTFIFGGELELYPRFYTEPGAFYIDVENIYTVNDYTVDSSDVSEYHNYNFDDLIYYINEDYANKFILLVALNNSDLTLKLICDNYPTLNNIVFYLNETSMVDFKESPTAPTEPNIKCRIVDANNTVLTPTNASKIYANITVCMDWQFYN